MQLEIADRQDVLNVPRRAVSEVLSAGLSLEDVDGDLSVVLVDDDGIVELNRRFLGRDRVTDVLAFPYETNERIEGEIIVNAELARRVARDHPHSAEDELMLYIVHGLLHMLGYDDHSEEDARRMRRREQEVLNAAGRSVEY